MSGPGESGGPGRAVVVGTGLIGGSIGLALRARGWHVSGQDRDESRVQRAVALGAIDAAGEDPRASITFVATPVGAVVEQGRRALAGAGVVTDVAGVKEQIVGALDDARFVGGHPMAGSEQVGVEGADANLFEGATWVLTPTEATDAAAFTYVRDVVTSLGAHVVAISPRDHDQLVAVVSHVPHLTAASLMTLAAEGADEHAALLRLAAGGFRDMTRIAAGHPGIWPDICSANRPAILAALDRLVDSLGAVRRLVDIEDRDGLLAALGAAHQARRNLPVRPVRPEDLVELRVPIPDRPGALAEVTTLAGELGVNIEDLAMAHSPEGSGGTMLMVVDARSADLMRGALLARGYRPSAQPL
ncbi:MAG TPA: prephenate dehydrogenase [Acidimicrobiales bacterium]|nr:prephenate dehydrogenase [Acidimicrobiales bacterium]